MAHAIKEQTSAMCENTQKSYLILLVVLMLIMTSASVAEELARDETKAGKFANCSVVAKIYSAIIEREGATERYVEFTEGSSTVFMDTAIQLSDETFVYEIMVLEAKEFSASLKVDKDEAFAHLLSAAEECAKIMETELFPIIFKN